MKTLTTTLVTVALLFMGCGAPQPSGPFIQEGTQPLVGAETEVFYPVPYESPPNLNIPQNIGTVNIVEPRPDGFKVRTNNLSEFKWRAEGVRKKK